MRAAPQPIVAAIDGVCAGAGAILAMASDLRFGTERSRMAFLFVRVGLAGCDMGACAILPRIIGLGRAAELLYTGRAMPGRQAYEWGFLQRALRARCAAGAGAKLARELAQGPTVAHAMTKRMLHDEWAMPLDAAIDAEARAQASCMETPTSAAPTKRSRQTRPDVRRKLMASESTGTRVAVLRRRASRVCRGSRAMARAGRRARRRTQCRRELSRVGARACGGGWLRACVPAHMAACAPRSMHARSVSARETLAYRSALADFAFAMQGLGSGAIALFGSCGAAATLSCRTSSTGDASPPSRSRNARRAPTSRRWRRARGATATRTCSTARRPGSRMPASPISTSFSREPAAMAREG